jgi:hypothetical protein
MPLPFATIALTLASAGLKVFGGESKLLEFAAHPLDVAAGHVVGEGIVEMAERFRRWYEGNQPTENEDLERAVTRSALLADLFCLLDVMPSLSSRIGPLSDLREHFKKWLPDRSPQGVVSQAEIAAMRSAIDARERRLKEIQEGRFVQAPVDPLNLVLPDLNADWGAKLASSAWQDARDKEPGLPNRLAVVFRQRWFAYLCLAFQDQVKTETRVRASFITLQIATGFETLQTEIRDFRAENREQHAETHRMLRALNARPTVLDVATAAHDYLPTATNLIELFQVALTRPLSRHELDGVWVALPDEKKIASASLLRLAIKKLHDIIHYDYELSKYTGTIDDPPKIIEQTMREVEQIVEPISRRLPSRQVLMDSPGIPDRYNYAVATVADAFVRIAAVEYLRSKNGTHHVKQAVQLNLQKLGGAANALKYLSATTEARQVQAPEGPTWSDFY